MGRLLLVGRGNVASASLCCGKELDGGISPGSVSKGVEAIHVDKITKINQTIMGIVHMS